MIGEFLFDAADRAELVLQRGSLLHYALRTRSIVPQLRIFGQSIELG
jgi:hypothetical protein